jgi:hypothetical protein
MPTAEISNAQANPHRPDPGNRPASILCRPTGGCGPQNAEIWTPLVSTGIELTSGQIGGSARVKRTERS